MDDKHEPAGSPKGGQFAKKSGNQVMNDAIRKGAGIETFYSDVKTKGTYGKLYLITGDGKLYDTYNEDTHAEFIGKHSSPQEFGLNSIRQGKFLKAYQTEDESKKTLMMNAWNSMFESGMIRISESTKEIDIETDRIDDSTLKRLQHLYDQGKLGMDSRQTMVWGGHSTENYIDKISYKDFLSAKHVKVGYGHAELV